MNAIYPIPRCEHECKSHLNVTYNNSLFERLFWGNGKDLADSFLCEKMKPQLFFFLFQMFIYRSFPHTSEGCCDFDMFTYGNTVEIFLQTTSTTEPILSLSNILSSNTMAAKGCHD